MGLSTPRVPVAVLVFDGVRLLDVTGPLEVFDVAAELGTGYVVTVCSPDGRDITTSSGLRLGVDRAAADVSAVDTLVVPGGECLVKPGADDELLTAIRHLSRGARRVTSVCAGAFALGAAGMLDGRRATTHWRHADTLQDRYPAVEVDAEAIYVRDGRVLTSAGVSSGIDLALALVEEDAGDVLAHEIARELVVFMRRRGAQPQLSVPARTPRPRRDLVRTLCDEVAADPAGNHCLTSMAQRAGLSTRHLSRLFKEGTGQTPATYVAAVRREAAVALVLSGETVAAAARRSGLGSDETLRRHLRAHPED